MGDADLTKSPNKEDLISSTEIENGQPKEAHERTSDHENKHASISLEDDGSKQNNANVNEQPNVIDQEELIVEDQHYQEGHQFVNMVQITQEDIYEAGFDVEDLNHLTEEQLNIVVSISQQRQAKQNGSDDNGGEGVEGENQHHMMHHGIMENDFEEGAAGENNEYGAEDGSTHLIENDMQLILTSDGGVNITDSKQRHFYISPEEIANLNIDLNNFNHDHVQQLLQLALPTIKETDKNDVSAFSRDVLEQTPSTSYHSHHHEHLDTDADKDSRTSIIGETVQIRTSDGRLQDAVVKYFKGNSEFKIQLMDGEFAYATVDQMLVPQKGRGDHSNYQAPTAMLIRRTDMARLSAQKRAAGNTEELCPPVLKRSYQLAPVVDGPHAAHTPNFCCPICDKKVFQKEPSYIVIRLPACDACTREKIIVLDEQNS